MAGLERFELSSITPENINWSIFKQYLETKYAKGYVTLILELSKKYYSYLNDVNQIQPARPTIRNNMIKSLIALSRFKGTYDAFKGDMKNHGITYYKPDLIAVFTRIFSSNAHDGLDKWYNDAMADDV